ncbi:MAG: hypothetical protein EZS28_048643 [Streblomastix strix]|uniref:Uncharacterized protein n=1 Tax=Streblomastix strix TaxID=222440 RepID=A0A5J4TDZ5_9EUKA|nr:MAG: hypothetical protein EZS28_048643 [Streblomastix strix]
MWGTLHILITTPDQRLMKLSAQQIIDLIKNKLVILIRDLAQGILKKSTSITQLTAFIRRFNQLKQQNLNTYTPFCHFCYQPPQQQMKGQQPSQYLYQYTGQPKQYMILPTQFTVIATLNPFLPAMNPPQIQMNEPRLQMNQNVRDQQSSIQPSQQMKQAAIQTVERPLQNATTTRNKHNMLIQPITAYLKQQPARIPLLTCTKERNQQRQSQRSISPTLKKAEESEDDDFLDEIIPGITMLHLPPHMSDIETAQKT